MAVITMIAASPIWILRFVSEVIVFEPLPYRSKHRIR